MGERGQIKMMPSGVYLYTHWRGYDLKPIVKEALAKKWRWDDEEYLARIIFDVLTQHKHDTETGFGIGAEEHGDLNYPLITIDTDKSMVIEDGGKVWTFDEFIKQPFTYE